MTLTSRRRRARPSSAQTLDVMRQLNLQGEIDWPPSQPVGHIDFNVSRPNGSAQVRVDLNAKQAYVKEFENGSSTRFRFSIRSAARDSINRRASETGS